MYQRNRIKILVISLILFVGAVGYIIFGFTSKCGGFEAKTCPRGFRCNLTEEPGFVLEGNLDRCELNIGEPSSKYFDD